MTSQQLPEHPNLEQLKKQAKGLLHAAQAKAPDALARFQVLPAYSRKTPEALGHLPVALHDAQSVVAREHGFGSWKALREAVEERSLSFANAAEEFVRFAVGGAAARARRLLALHPAIARSSFHVELVLGDVAGVEARLKADPSLAKGVGGPKEWEPLQYLCQTSLFQEDDARAADLVAVAQRLLACGGNPNAQYHWQWHAELPRTVLWGALCTVRSVPLAKILLEAGADPTDGVTLQIVGSGQDTALLDLLLAFGAKLDGRPGGVPPLRYILGYATDPTGPRWLLEHGADANLSWGDLDEAPIHVAAQRWDVAMVELLVRHGADLARRRTDGRTAHTLAALNGNHAVARWLLAHGAVDELSPLERFVAACTRADRAEVRALLGAHPRLPAELRAEHHRLLRAPAERGDAAALETMLLSGFDPRVGDRDRVTALHRAAMAGEPECVRLLLAHGASPNALDGMFAAPAIVWAAEGWKHPRPGSGHVAVVRQLVAAGSVEWQPAETNPQVEGTLETLAELRAAAAVSAGSGA